MLMDTRAGADTPEAAQGREATAQAVLAADSAAPIVDAMIAALFSKMTLEQHPERVEPMRAVMEQTTPEESPAPCAAWRAGPTGGATLPRSRSRRSSWSARKM